ncbi:Superfamily II DNA/RNA helicase, SNF2 family [Rhodotorula toruloides ATCC 204091]|uniref:BY PROTMAP: gi/342319990/gb/EGU11935.1/ Superfamily II DNA/RNA helicase, SNF2 family [Rhodotorula glutinis ATCC 204091] n=1 Tax=Rhodotorula toruloides TaxID=5286 RepID=A0A0K3CNW2_RHOTO|nr:Superfamily II DNA/RNA helicase, SNF2 family [Rhodotorula toruloides ATCC 204091]
MNLPVSISPPIAIFLLATQQCQVYSHLNKSRMLPPFFSVTDSLRYDTEGIAALTARLHERCVLWLFDGMDTGDQKLADALQGVPLNVFMSPAEALARRMNLPTR